MSEHSQRRRSLVTARDKFLDGDDSGLRGVSRHVAASWRRCLSSGVQPGVVGPSYFADLDVDTPLVRGSRAVIEHLADQLADLPACIALADNEVRLVNRHDGDLEFGRLMERVCFTRGFGYSEAVCGTNGVGSVLEVGRSVTVVGAEHFVDAMQVFGCAGAAINDPFTGRVVGVIDISCRAEHASPVMHSIVRAAATEIERNLLTDRDPRQLALFDGYSRLEARGRQAVLAVGPRLMIANSTMQTLLDAPDQEALREHVRFVMHRRPAVDEHVDLPSGAQVRVRGKAIAMGRDIVGMVVVVALNKVDDHAAATTAAPRPVPGPVSGCPAWRAAAATVETALRAGDPVLVLGEQGAGRLRLLSEMFGRVHGDGRTVSIEATAIEQDPQGVATRLTRVSRRPVLRVLRDIDTVSGQAIGTLVAALGNETPASIAATATEVAAPGAPHQSLLTLFRASATVPPLRHRAADLPALVTAVLADLAPHRDVRLSRDALRLLTHYGWPGNVSQLVEALSAAQRRRPVGRIEAADLPRYCHSNPRRALRPIDEIERDAIVDALRAADGNRVAAAAALGLARSTLYLKIHQYGITV